MLIISTILIFRLQSPEVRKSGLSTGSKVWVALAELKLL